MGDRQKRPTPEAIDAIQKALKLDPVDYNDLLTSAGYSGMPEDPDPTVSVIARLTRQEAKRGAKLGTAEALVEAGLGEKKPNQPIPAPPPKPRTAHFVGREDEIKWLKARLLAGDETALVGVKAIGGMGKTELAIAAVHDNAVKNNFPGDIFWLECGTRPTEAVQERLAEALGVQLTSIELSNRAAALSLALSQRPKTLLVLDDMRRNHIAEFNYLRPSSPNCAVLVTSRRDDLPLDDTAVKKLDVLTEKKGEELLRSLVKDSNIVLNEEVISQIAYLLEQIPLALTLAAGRAKRIAKYNQDDPFAELLTDLKQRRLDALAMSDASKDLSVRITFDASYDDLNETEQWWLAQLGLFARNSFDLETVCWIWQLDEGPAKTAMDQLIFAGLVDQTEKSQYWMHDLLREYAESCLTRFLRRNRIVPGCVLPNFGR